jgi:hypothetical protein
MHFIAEVDERHRPMEIGTANAIFWLIRIINLEAVQDSQDLFSIVDTLKDILSKA